MFISYKSLRLQLRHIHHRKHFVIQVLAAARRPRRTRAMTASHQARFVRVPLPGHLNHHALLGGDQFAATHVTAIARARPVGAIAFGLGAIEGVAVDN